MRVSIMRRLRLCILIIRDGFEEKEVYMDGFVQVVLHCRFDTRFIVHGDCFIEEFLH